MNYGQQELSGFFSMLIGVGKAGYEYGVTAEQVKNIKRDTALTEANDQAYNTALTREAGYAANRAELQAQKDAQNLKRNIIIGSAIGLPVLAFALLKKKG